MFTRLCSLVLLAGPPGVLLGLGLLPGPLLLHGHPEGERQLGVVVGVDAELEAPAAGGGHGARPVLALNDGGGEQGVGKMGTWKGRCFMKAWELAGFFWKVPTVLKMKCQARIIRIV